MCGPEFISQPALMCSKANLETAVLWSYKARVPSQVTLGKFPFAVLICLLLFSEFASEIRIQGEQS